MNYESPIYPPQIEFSFFLYRSTTDEKFACIGKLPAKTFSGDDKINNQTIKLAAAVISPILSKLVNLSFQEGKLPNELAKAQVLPLPKGGPKNDENNYRPIAKLNALSKVYERVMNNIAYAYFEKFNFCFIINSLDSELSIVLLMP